MITAVSLFAGVGGFDLALERAGVKVAASVEIDKHARSVLEKRFPNTKLFNDVCEVKGNDLRDAGFVPNRGILVGGFPCQDLSVAGKRAGLDGARSGLYWEIIRIVDETQVEWVILENVPGLLSSQRGADMGAVVGALADRGYCVGWRVLDAQYFGVPQRRRRVFIVARRSGDPESIGQVLFERESLRGDHSQGRATGQETASTSGESVESTSEPVYSLEPGAAQRMDSDRWWEEISPTLRAKAGDNQVAAGPIPVEPSILASEMTGKDVAGTIPASLYHKDTVVNQDVNAGHLVVEQTEPMGFNAKAGIDIQARVGTSTTLKVTDGGGAAVFIEEPTLYEPHHGDGRETTGLANTLNARMGTGGNNTPVVIEQEVFVKAKRAQNDQDDETWKSDAPHPTLNQFDQGDSRTVAIAVEPIAIQGSVVGRNDQAGPGGKGHGEVGDPMFTLNTTDRHGIATSTVRRLTPLECERLQGFPDNWTEGQADSHRYKQMGNAVAVPVVQWLIDGVVGVINNEERA